MPDKLAAVINDTCFLSVLFHGILLEKLIATLSGFTLIRGIFVKYCFEFYTNLVHFSCIFLKSDYIISYLQILSINFTHNKNPFT